MHGARSGRGHEESGEQDDDSDQEGEGEGPILTEAAGQGSAGAEDQSSAGDQ